MGTTDVAGSRSQDGATGNREPAAFIEIHVDTAVEECARRDPKGLYAKARAGERILAALRAAEDD